MFARPSSSAYVCLRCHLRLTRQRPLSLSSILPHRIPLTISCIRPFYSSPRSQWDDALGPTNDNGGVESRPRRRGKFYHPLGKLRGKKGGQQVRENAEALSVNTLGKPAEVIVLRDAPRHDSREAPEQGRPEEDDAAAKSSSRAALLDAIEGEDVVMDQETVNQQIDDLRPQVEDPNSGRLIVQAKEYYRLCKVLTDSYSRSQLDAYMSRPKAMLPEQASTGETKESLESKNPDIQFRPWKPSSKSDRLPKYLGMADTKNFRRIRRSRLASALLLKCWKVEVAEEVERLGEIVCTLPKVGIRLLTAGKPSYLDEIAENRQAKLEVDGQNIRIIADKDSALYILEDINRLWSLRHTEQFRLTMPSSPSAQPSTKDKKALLVAFRPEDVAWASSLTKTTMTYTNGSQRTIVTITGIGKDSVEDATRTLLALVDIPTKLHEQTFLAGNTGLVLQEISDLGALPFRSRRVPFGRFYSPATRTETEAPVLDNEPNRTESDEQPSLSDTGSVEDQGADLNSPIILAADRDAFDSFVTTTFRGSQKRPRAIEQLLDDKFWNDTPQSRFSASPGLVIHPKSLEVASKITPVPSDWSDDASFLHRVPGLSQVLPHLSWNRENVVDVLSFRLLHNPWKQAGPALPEIRLDFEINNLNEDERTAKFKALYAVCRDRRGHVLLPSQAVDLSFRGKSIFHAKPDCLENQPDVQRFIEQTRANILDGSGKLRAPGSVLIRVPIIVAEPFASVQTRAPDEKPSKAIPAKLTPQKDSRTYKWHLPETANRTDILAHYHFIGVEHLQIASYTFEGYSVRYTSVEGGKLGGKYGNLEILMPFPDLAKDLSKERVAKQLEEERKTFTEAALKLVQLVDLAAHGKLQRPGPVAQPTNADLDIDQDGMEQWTPEHLNETRMQPSTGHEDDMEERPGDELSESASHHTAIATGTDADILSRAGPEPVNKEVSPAADLDDGGVPIEIASDECPLGQGQSTISKPFDVTEHEEEAETAETENEPRAAASG